MNAAVKEANTALQEARRALSEVKKAREEALRAVHYEHDSIVAQHTVALNQAEQALREVISAATPDHEWDGRKVFQVKRKRTHPWEPVSETRIEGIVFTYRPGINLGPGWSWRTPEIGEPLVRHLKKDGNPGAKTERFNDYNGRTPWTLIEEPQL